MPTPWYAHRARVGRLGEALAAAFLERRGAEVTGRNLVVGRGEIDLTVEMDGRRAAVEVKSIAGDHLDPRDAFTEDKADQVRRLAARLDPPTRIVDLVTVQLGSNGVVIRWTPDAG